MTPSRLKRVLFYFLLLIYICSLTGFNCYPAQEDTLAVRDKLAVYFRLEEINTDIQDWSVNDNDGVSSQILCNENGYAEDG